MYVNFITVQKLTSNYKYIFKVPNLIFQSDGKSTVETNESKEDIMYVEQKPLYNQNNVDDEEEQFEALLQQLGMYLIITTYLEIHTKECGPTVYVSSYCLYEEMICHMIHI